MYISSLHSFEGLLLISHDNMHTINFVGDIYLRVTLLNSFDFNVFSKPTNDPIESAAYMYNCSQTRKHTNY